jgi:hypothetical protein
LGHVIDQKTRELLAELLGYPQLEGARDVQRFTNSFSRW